MGCMLHTHFHIRKILDSTQIPGNCGEVCNINTARLREKLIQGNIADSISIKKKILTQSGRYNYIIDNMYSKYAA